MKTRVRAAAGATLTYRVVAAACAMLACSGAGQPPAPSPRLAPAAPIAAPAPRSIPQYRLLWREGERPPLQVLIAGERLELAEDGSVQSATSVATTALMGGRRVPGTVGGFVFWGGSAVYRADSFLAPLEPLASAPWSVSNVAFGPGYWLLLSSGGQRFAIDEAGGEHAPDPPGLIDIEATPDGRVAGLLELGRAVVSTDRGAHYREVQAELGGNASRLSREPLGFVLSGDVVIGLEPDGKLVRLPKERSKPSQETDGVVRTQLALARQQVRNQLTKGRELVEAISEGVLVAPGQALVAIDAALVRVDLLTGEVLSQSEQLVPGSSSCKVLRLGRELLMACRGNGDLTIFGGIEAGKPRLERIFKDRLYTLGAGQLMLDGACTGDASSSVCVRSEGAEWHSLRCPLADPAPAPSATLPAPPNPAPNQKPIWTVPLAPPKACTDVFIAREGGGVVALMGEPVSGYVDMISGQTVKFEGNFSLLEKYHDSCIVDGSRSLRCVGPNYSVAIDRDGKPEQGFQLKGLRTAPGGRALGWADKSHLFQTEDYGRNWTEVAAPPASPASHAWGQCSEVGCIVDGWLRTGWDVVKPHPRESSEVAPQPAERVAALPRVVCRSAEPPKLPAPEHANLDDDSDSSNSKTWGFGLQELPSDDFINALLLGTPAQAKGADTSAPDRGVAYGFTRERPDPHQKGSTITVASPLTFRYVAHFDPSASIASANVRWEELVRAARSAGAQEPDSSVFQAGSLGITPVLSSAPGKAAGFLVAFENAVVWVNGARTLALTPPPDGYTVLSALVLPRQELAVLYDDAAGRSRIFQYEADGRGVEVGETPPDPPSTEPTADALALSPSGKLAVLRFPSTQSAPTAGDPAFAYTPGASPERLAPWTTLTAASDAACKNAAGYRAIVATSTGWISATRDASEPGDDWGTLALVRWSAERVCLEAVEGSVDNFSRNDGDVPTRIVWTLSPKSRAARVGFAGGFELRQAQNCELLPAPPPAAPPAGLLRRPRAP